MTLADLTPHMILFLAGVVAVTIAIVTIALAKDKIGSAAIAASLAAGFAALTAVTVWSEGVWLVVENHTLNLWGIQVWYDLLLSVSIALFFILPRARAVGMNVLPWILLVALTASIGLLAMAARLFWLERAGVGDKPLS
ncbi:hypothetical protein LY632_06495 [Erythrobacter sp. SDW2]|uniref:hypothetical protein n=1 Tax=Erythrobacter sp. SDW2 TaxID=2907154 RepID=UPI001F158C9B|nr:hypothetical protein [Erythrobacter sp. SDW2]UIP08037.1 hypothetical protein LY632_06495 [Erythrobacter sp. SDW2]